MFSWIIKMLLKFMKPIAKFAIMAGLLETILGNDGAGDDEATDPSESEEAEG